MLSDLRNVLLGVSLIGEVSDRTRDLLVSFGERISARVFAQFVRAAGTSAQAYDSWEIGMLTTKGGGSATSSHSAAELLPESPDRMRAFLKPFARAFEHVPVVTGFIAHDLDGKVTTLGRDGSDLSAALIGAAVRASEVQIWKDVDGILTCDPRIVPSARPVEAVTFEEAAELTYFGSKVVHPRAVMPCMLAGVTMVVRNTHDPSLPGTQILKEHSCNHLVTALTCKRGVTLIDINSTRMLGQHGFLAKVFEIFNRFEVSVDVIATSEVSISCTLDKGFRNVDITGLTTALETCADVATKEEMALVTLITARPEKSTEVLAKVFQTLNDLNVDVEMLSRGASKVNVSFLIADANLQRVAQSLHTAFFEGYETRHV